MLNPILVHQGYQALQLRRCTFWFVNTFTHQSWLSGVLTCLVLLDFVSV